MFSIDPVAEASPLCWNIVFYHVTPPYTCIPINGDFLLESSAFCFHSIKKGFKSVLNVSDSAAYLDLFNLKLKVILPDIFRRTLTFPLHVVSGLKVRSKDQ